MYLAFLTSGDAERSADGLSLRGDLGPEVGALLSDGASDVLSLHLSLGVDDDSSVVYKRA